MVMEKYRIVSRYEYYSNSGITWTKWFQEIFTPVTDSENELKEILKDCKEKSKSITKASKRKTEYKIEKFDYKEIELKNIPKSIKNNKKKTKK